MAPARCGGNRAPCSNKKHSQFWDGRRDYLTEIPVIRHNDKISFDGLSGNPQIILVNLEKLRCNAVGPSFHPPRSSAPDIHQSGQGYAGLHVCEGLSRMPPDLRQFMVLRSFDARLYMRERLTGGF
jgi:hypothetical protein